MGDPLVDEVLAQSLVLQMRAHSESDEVLREAVNDGDDVLAILRAVRRTL